MLLRMIHCYEDVLRVKTEDPLKLLQMTKGKDMIQIYIYIYACIIPMHFKIERN